MKSSRVYTFHRYPYYSIDFCFAWNASWILPLSEVSEWMIILETEAPDIREREAKTRET